MAQNSPLFAAIDLGSNSFHMLVVQEVAGSVRVLAKIKRKVRLAQGLDSNQLLSDEAMERGWNCLRLFAEQLRDIPVDNVRIVATATLRLAKNATTFIAKASRILKSNVRIISGEEEAALIYQGVCHTSNHSGHHLVIDIGGASTELIIGEQEQQLELTSLHLGCVTWLQRYFADDKLNESNFANATTAAARVINKVAPAYQRLGWSECSGASGTVQAIQEALAAQGETEIITLEKLHALKAQAIACGSIQSLQIEGLKAERLAVFPSGLAILIALFEVLCIERMTLAGGALREGVLYSMLGRDPARRVGECTIQSLLERYQIDREQAKCVLNTVEDMANQLAKSWALNEDALYLLQSAAWLHEIGLCIEYKKAPQHAAYLIENLTLPGFTPAQQQLLAALLLNQRDAISVDRLQKQSALESIQAMRLLRLLRLGIILCIRRNMGSVPDFIISAQGDALYLTLPADWMKVNYLRTSLLNEESEHQQTAGWPLHVTEAKP